MSKYFRFLFITALVSCFAISHEAQALDQTEFDKAMDSYLAKEDNLDKVGKALETYFRKKRDEQQKVAEQEDSQKMEEQFKNPVKVDIKNSPVKGNPSAKITIVEFSDFQCPFCSRGKQVMDDVLKEYPDKVKVAFKHLPLPFHPNAKPAARASLAAQEQGKFWEMHDELFNNQESLSDEKYGEIAKQIGLNVDKFKADLAANAQKYDKMIDDDAALATQLGVRGTPGFFVNGVLVSGARPLPYFKEIIDRWLKKS